MSQHDFNIANQGFPATRADINNAFQAIASNSSGATAPSTTYANMWWYDTTNNKMYLRNEADSAWIEVATIDQTNNEWQITTGTIQAADSDGLALKTDDGTTRLFIKDSDGAVGIGTSSPSSKLHIADADNAASGFRMNNTAGESVQFYYASSAADADFIVNRTGSGAADMGIDHEGNVYFTSGRVGIGTTSSTNILHVAAASGSSVLNLQRTDTNTAGGVGTVQFAASDNHVVSAIAAIADGDNEGAHLSFRTTSAASGTNWFSSTTERMRVLASGGLTFNGDTAAANALDDYEEGTWTPNDISGAGLTFSSVVGKYTKIGNLVFVMCELVYPTTSNTADMDIGGLPYPATDTFRFGGVMAYTTSSTAGSAQIVNRSTTSVMFRENGSSIAMDNNDLSGKTIRFSMTYQTT